MKRNTARSNGRHPNRALFGVAALVLLAVAAFSYRQWEQFKRANAKAAQTRDVVDSIDRLLSSVTDAETGQRGFLLTGEDRYLQTYNQARTGATSKQRCIAWSSEAFSPPKPAKAAG